MGEKWICPKCGQENDDLFCIQCGTRRPEIMEADDVASAEELLEKATEPAIEEPAAPDKQAAKKKSPLLKIIIAAAVVVVAVIVVLCLTVFNKKPKTYKNEIGNYSIDVPAGYKITEFDNGILAESKEAVFFVDYLNTDYKGALVYDWYDLVEFTDRIYGELNYIWGITELTTRILSPSTYGDDGIYSYSMEVVTADDQTCTGEFHIQNAKKLGVYCICYYILDGTSDKKAEKIREDFASFKDSFSINGAPNIPDYEHADLTEMYLGELMVRSDLVGDISVGGKMCIIKDPSKNEEIMIEIIFANSVLEIFSWEGITDGQIEESVSEKIEKGRNKYDTYRAVYRDKKNNKRAYGIYGIFADTSHPGVIAIEYNVSADMQEWAEEVISDIMWSWYIHD